MKFRRLYGWRYEMKPKKLFILLLIVSIIIAGFASCKQEGGTATMKLMLKKTDLGAKTLTPGDASSLQITRFRLTGNGPKNATFDITTDNTSVTINGLEVGTWNVTAKGLNASGTELVQGSTVYELTQNSGTAQLVLDEMVGTGTFILNIDWVNTEVPDPSLQVFLTAQGGVEGPLAAEPDYNNRTASISKSLAAGSYIVRGVLKSGDFHVGGFVDSIRIVGGQTTQGSVSISQMQYADASGYFLLTNKAGEPVRGTMTGFGTDQDSSPILEANTDKVIKFTLDNAFETAPGLRIQWFLDGLALSDSKILGKENQITANITPGSHRIDAVVSNDLLGSYGCVSTTFLAMLSSTKGALSKLSDFSTILIGKVGGQCQYLTLGSDTIVSPLPSGKFLIVSPSKSKIAVMKVVRNCLDLVKVYDEKDFPYIADIKMVRSDAVLPWIVIQDEKGGTENMSFLKFNQADGTISYCTGLSRIEGDYKINDTITAKLGDVKAIEIVGSANRVYIWDESCTILNDTRRRSMWFQIDGDKVVCSGPDIENVAFSDSNKVSFSPSGNSVARTQDGSCQIMFNEVHSRGTFGEWKYVGNTTTAPSDVILAADNCIIAANGSLERFTADYLSITSPATVTPQTVELSSDQIILDAQAAFLYAMDSASRTIYSLSRSSAGVLERIGNCKISQNSGIKLTMMAMAGPNILVAADSGYLTLCRVTQ